MTHTHSIVADSNTTIERPAGRLEIAPGRPSLVSLTLLSLPSTRRDYEGQAQNGVRQSVGIADG